MKLRTWWSPHLILAYQQNLYAQQNFLPSSCHSKLFRREQLVLRLHLGETHLLLSGASVGIPASRPIVQFFNHLAIKQGTCSFIGVGDMTVKLLGCQLWQLVAPKCCDYEHFTYHSSLIRVRVTTWLSVTSQDQSYSHCCGMESVLVKLVLQLPVLSPSNSRQLSLKATTLPKHHRLGSGHRNQLTSRTQRGANTAANWREMLWFVVKFLAGKPDPWGCIEQRYTRGTNSS